MRVMRCYTFEGFPAGEFALRTVVRAANVRVVPLLSDLAVEEEICIDIFFEFLSEVHRELDRRD